MKSLYMLLKLMLVTSIAISQTQSTVTINATGNRNKQVVVDNKTYTIDNASATEQQTVLITDLAAGQHSMELLRVNSNNRNVSTKSNFTLRDGYDLTITVASNGSISSAEQRTTRAANAQISVTAFNKLYAQVKAKTSSTARATALESEFNNNKRKFSSKQASQLIQLVNSESLRLKLAKQSYPKISDQQNFTLVSNLLNSTANRTELNTYISSIAVEVTDDETAVVNTNAPMTESNFRVIYNEVMAETSSSDRGYYLNNFFSRDFNYYSSSQAKQLIELISTEQDRLAIAKTAYRGVTDKESYNATIYPILASTSSKSDLAAYIRTYDISSPRLAMNAASFDKLYLSVYNLNSSSSRNTAINNAFTTAGNYFTVAQAKKLIPLVSDQNSRLLLAKTAYKVLTDRSNYLQFNDFLSTTASRNDFANYVNNYEIVSAGTGSTVRTPMTETDFNNLYRNVQFAFGLGAKYSALTEVFNTETNYFTVAQAKQLIQLVSSESNRLELAKASYNNITDPANFSQVYDLFSSQANKNALIAYVNSSAYNN